MNKKVIAAFMALAIVAGTAGVSGIQSISNADLTAYAAETSVENSDSVNLEDGIYKVNVNMVKVDRFSASMSDAAIDHQVKLEVIDGKYYVTMAFKGLSILGQRGYLKSLSYYDEGYTYNNYGIPQGTVKPTEVTSYYNGFVDYYNDINTPYPHTLKFPLVDGGNADYVPLQVFVPVMEAISAGSGTQDVLMKIDWDTLEKKESNLTGSSLSVDGEIKLNNYIELSDTVTSDPNAKVVTTVNGFTIETPVSKAKNTEHGYLFPAYVPAKDMTSAITTEVTLGDGTVVDTYTSTVEQYAADLIYSSTSTATDKQKAMLKALLNYGAYAQLNFGTNTNDLANAKLSAEEKSLDSVPDDVFDSYGYVKEGNERTSFKIRYMGSCLTLYSKTAIKHYFKIPASVNMDNLTFTANGVEVTPIADFAKGDNYYYVPITGISVNNLATPYNITVTNGTNTVTLDYSAFDYCKVVQNSNEAADELKNLTKALYLFYQSAQ